MRTDRTGSQKSLPLAARTHLGTEAGRSPSAAWPAPRFSAGTARSHAAHSHLHVGHKSTAGLPAVMSIGQGPGAVPATAINRTESGPAGAGWPHRWQVIVLGMTPLRRPR